MATSAVAQFQTLRRLERLDIRRPAILALSHYQAFNLLSWVDTALVRQIETDFVTTYEHNDVMRRISEVARRRPDAMRCCCRQFVRADRQVA